MNIQDLSNSIIKQAQEDLETGWERATIILETEPFKKLKSISDIKGLFIKDIVNDLIKMYNKVAITDKDKQNIEKEKQRLQEEINKLVKLQESFIDKKEKQKIEENKTNSEIEK